MMGLSGRTPAPEREAGDLTLHNRRENRTKPFFGQAFLISKLKRDGQNHNGGQYERHFVDTTPEGF